MSLGPWRSLFGSSLLVCALFLVGCAESSDGSSADGAVDPSSYGESLGRFQFTVDTSAAEPIKVESLDDGASLPGLTLKTTEDLGEGASIFQHVTLTGPGTWHGPPDNELRAEVIVSRSPSAPTANAFDEPQLVVTAFSQSGPGEVTFVSRHGGGINEGAVIAFSDIQSTTSPNLCPGFGVRTNAKHALRIHVTEAATTTFSFTVDVRAHPVAANAAVIAPDCDNDGFNPESEDAGDDCNDGNPSIQFGCTCTPGATTCASNGYCNPPAGGVSCTPVSPCQCPIDCSGQSQSCGVETCSLGANCTLACEDNEQHCQIGTCTLGTTCNTSCSGDNALCGITNCSLNTTCNVTCGCVGAGCSPQGNPTSCGIEACQIGATCAVTCGNVASASSCTLNCGLLATSCRMDCSQQPTQAARNQCRDGLVCPFLRPRQQVPGLPNVWRCGG